MICFKDGGSRLLISRMSYNSQICVEHVLSTEYCFIRILGQYDVNIIYLVFNKKNMHAIYVINICAKILTCRLLGSQ